MQWRGGFRGCFGKEGVVSWTAMEPKTTGRDRPGLPENGLRGSASVAEAWRGCARAGGREKAAGTATGRVEGR